MELQEAAGGPGDDVQQVRHVPCDDVCWSQLLTSPSGKHLSERQISPVEERRGLVVGYISHSVLVNQTDSEGERPQ